MAFVIERSFDPSYKSLLQRPRVSYKVSEYVFDFINKNLLKPSRVLQSDKYTYVFTFSFSFFIPEREFPYTSPFATDKRLFFSQRGFRTFDKTQKWATLMVLANDIDQTIMPYDYATASFKMLADFLLKNYRKFEKAQFDELLSQLDRQQIESFPFPASFDEQKYSLDDTNYPVIPLSKGTDWVDLDQWETINPRVEYLKHYPE